MKHGDGSRALRDESREQNGGSSEQREDYSHSETNYIK